MQVLGAKRATSTAPTAQSTRGARGTPRARATSASQGLRIGESATAAGAGLNIGV
jgi:hypothetical protein